MFVNIQARALSISMILYSFIFIFTSHHWIMLPMYPWWLRMISPWISQYLSIVPDSTCRSSLKWSWEWVFIGLRVQITVSPIKQLPFTPARRWICSMINEFASAVALFVLLIRCFRPDECRKPTRLRRQLRRRVSEMNKGLFRRSLEMDACGPDKATLDFGCCRFETSPLVCVEDSPGASNEGVRFNPVDAENSCH